MTISTRVIDGTPVSSRSLVSLLGAPRAAIVERLHRDGDASVAELATHLAVSEVATRRHVAVLEADGLLEAVTVKQGRGRPVARYHLTGHAYRLFPQRYDRFASEVMDFLADEHGRDGLREFLRWRLEREVAGLEDAVTAEDLQGRLQQLAEVLSDAGFEASVAADGDGFTLTQDHCAIADVATRHPEVCHYEAASFARVLGRDVKLSRRETLAGGANACVCCVSARMPAPSGALTAARAGADAADACGAPHESTHDFPHDYDLIAPHDGDTTEMSTHQMGRGDDL